MQAGSDRFGRTHGLDQSPEYGSSLVAAKCFEAEVHEIEAAVRYEQAEHKVTPGLMELKDPRFLVLERRTTRNYANHKVRILEEVLYFAEVSLLKHAVWIRVSGDVDRIGETRTRRDELRDLRRPN